MTKDVLPPTQIGMLLVGHGTRDELGIAEFLKTAAMVAELVPGAAVEPGFLELAEPSIRAAVERLARRGVVEVTVVPLLLFAAGHAKQDIPRMVAAAAAPFPRLRVRQAEPLGCHEQVLAASAARFREALQGADIDDAENVSLVMVSRGTSDAAAIADVRRFVELRCKLISVAETVTGFMAVAEPSIDQVLDSARLSSQTIVVQPHLLFHGQIVRDLQHKLAAARAREPARRIVQTGYLGPCDEIAAAAVGRFREAVSRFGG